MAKAKAAVPPIAPLDRALERKAPELDWSGDSDELVIRIDPEWFNNWYGTPGATEPDPESEALSRAMSAPLSFTARMGGRT